MILEIRQNPEGPQPSQAAQARGLELMARHRNLVHAVAGREIDVDVLINWSRSLTDEEWHLMAEAETFAAKSMTLADKRALLKAYDDAPMAGRAR